MTTPAPALRTVDVTPLPDGEHVFTTHATGEWRTWHVTHARTNRIVLGGSIDLRKPGADDLLELALALAERRFSPTSAFALAGGRGLRLAGRSAR